VATAGLAVGAFSFLLSSNTPPHTADAALLGAMAAISAVVLGVGDEVAIFLIDIDSALLFKEFFSRIARLAVQAFAFLTIYALLIVAFGAICALVDAMSAAPQFRVDGVSRFIDFGDSLYFSLTTLSLVSYGDITPATSLTRVLAAVEIIIGLLMVFFGVNEIMNYSRDHRRNPPEG
jgi:voltage-gated potassium channel